MKPITSLAVILVLASACARGESGGGAATSGAAASSSTQDPNEKAAMVSNAIAANPAAADSILKANGYTAESFEQEMFAIAADSARSAAYAAAKRP